MWQIEYTSVAEKFIRVLSNADKGKIMHAVESLQVKPDLGEQLVGPLKGLRSLRVGNYRIVYRKEKENLVILVVAIGQRKDIYRKL